MFFKDILYDAKNLHFDIGRFIGLTNNFVLIGAAVWNMHLKQPINLAEFGAGLSAVLGAIVVYIYHDRKENAA